MKGGLSDGRKKWGERWVVIDGEIQTHDTCKRGQSRPYRVTEILFKTEISAFLILKTCCQSIK